MNPAAQNRKARALLDLHTAGKILVLPNVWNPIGARVLEARGYPAIATASAAISASLGYEDGERIARSTMLGVVSRVVRAVEVPVTADMESGYADSPGELDVTTRGLIETGAVGMNIEDSAGEEGALRPIDEQAERIARVRETAESLGVHLVINARVDVFLSDGPVDAGARIEETIRRAEAYGRAGADCIYPIGQGDVGTLKLLRARIDLPLNALASPGAASIETLQGIGINRVSFGPFIFRSCLMKFAEIADALARHGDYGCFSREMMSRPEVREYLRPDSEAECPDPGSSARED